MLINYKQKYSGFFKSNASMRILSLSAILLACSCAHALTLQQTLDYTFENAPDVAISLSEESIQRYTLKSRLGAFLPSVDGAIDCVHDNYLSQGESTDPKTNLWRKDYSLVISQNLFDGMKRYNDYSSADRQLQASIGGVNDRTLAKITEVGASYFKVLLSQELLANAKENLKRLKAISDLIDRRVQQGLSRELDRIQAKGRLATARANIITAMADLHKNQALFKSQTGGLDPVDLQVLDLSHVIPSSYELFAQGVQAQGVRIHQYAFLKDAAYYNYQSSKSAFFPQIHGLTRFEYRKNIDGNTDHQTNTQVGINISYNLFRGAQDVQNTSAQAVRYGQAISELKRQGNELQYLTLASWEDFQSARQSFQYRKEHEQAVSAVVAGYKDQFVMGQRTLLDLFDAYNELYFSLNALAQDQAQLRIAELQIGSLTGEITELLSESVAAKVFKISEPMKKVKESLTFERSHDSSV